MESNEVVVKSNGLLESNLLKIINDNIDNKNLKSTLNEIFLEKGMQPSTVNSVFSGEKQVTQLNEYEKLNLVRGFNKYFYKVSVKDENKENEEKERKATNNWINGRIIKGKDFFAEKIINSYRDYTKPKEELEISEIKFENVIKCDENSFICAEEYNVLMNLMELGKIFYITETQREPRYISIGKNIRIPIPMVDEEAVNSIEEAMENGTFEDSQIVLGYLEEEDGEEADFNFYGTDVGVLRCDKLRIIDGNHRLIAATRFCNNYKAEHNCYPERKFSIRIVIGSESRLKRIVRQSFLRSKEISEEYKDTLADNNMNKFISEIINKSNVLNGNTAKTHDEMGTYDKTITTRKVIKQAIEYLNLDLNSRKVMTFKPKKIAESLDLLIDFMNEFNIELNYYNIYVAYIYFAYKVSELGNESEYYELFIDKLKNIKKEDIKKLKLGNKNYNSEEIIKYFNVF